MKHIAFLFYIISLVISCEVAFASLEITEIMYNPEGVDSGYEYVKIKNTGSDVSVAEYYFLENDIYHGLYPEEPILGSGDFAFIVKDIPTAKSRYGQQNYIKSSFSLNNTGESLAIADPGKNIISEFTYSSDMGGNGDGSPLYVNSSSRSTHSSSVSTSSSSQSTSSAKKSTVSKKIIKPFYEPYFEIKDPVVFSQSPFSFKAGVYYHDGLDVTRKKRGSYYINFGDGYAQEFDEHIDMNYQYQNPGEYHVVFEYYSSSLKKGNYEPDAYLEQKIVVIKPEIVIESFDRFSGLSIKNNTDKKVDLSEWVVVYNDQKYILPKYSFIGAHSNLSLPYYHLGFDVFIDKLPIYLLNDSSIPVASSVDMEKKKTVEAKATIVNNTRNTKSLEDSEDTHINVGDSAVVIDDRVKMNDVDENKIYFNHLRDDIGVYAHEKEQTTNTLHPLWFILGGIIMLSLLKIFFIRKTSHVSKEDEFDIELIK